MKNNDTQEISKLLGVNYESWLPKAREIIQIPDSPLSVREGVWKVSNRTELLPLLGSRILDQNLDSFQATAVKVLKERDPAFELPADERLAASIFGKVQSYSAAFRKGLAEGIALISNNPNAFSNASHGKAEAVGILAVRDILADADWVTWATLNNLLPTLAEAAPKEFLDAVDAALRLEPCPFDQVFAQEGDGLTGRNYLTGLLWALEGLAWDSDLLVSVSVLLAELASHDPGGNWANRPSNSLATILLPWLPQTLASIEKRRVAVQTVLAEQPSVGWKLLLQLLPGQHQVSTGAHKPVWRNSIPKDWEGTVSNKEYWDQVSAYSELAVRAACTDLEKLTQLISRLDDLVRPSFDDLLSRLRSDDILGLPEGQRRQIWDALVSFAGKHRKFADAAWALPGEAVEQIESVAKTLAPKAPFELYQHLFSDRDFDLYGESGNWQNQQKMLDVKREAAVQQILADGGIAEVLRFAEAVPSARQVGYALGNIGEESIDQTLLPRFLEGVNRKFTDVVESYVWSRHRVAGWSWSDSVAGAEWTLNQKAAFLRILPFSEDTWRRVTSWLGAEEGLYWSTVYASPYQTEGDLSFAIAKFINFGRSRQAIECLYKALHEKQSVAVEQVVRALLLGVSSSEQSGSIDAYRVGELIKFLQSEPSVSQDDLFQVEWTYLALLGSNGQGRPKLLEYKLATEPEFFCEVIKAIYRSKKEVAPPVENSEASTIVAANAWRLLHGWNTPPGTELDGSFSGQRFAHWLEKTKAICAESGHLEVALIEAGGVLINVPSDANGLWIDSTVASVLNGREHEDLRRGFSTAVYNSRGAHWVDPTGKPEKDLAENYRRKAEAVENAGFRRFAATLRDIAVGYEHDAERVIAEHKSRAGGDDLR